MPDQLHMHTEVTGSGDDLLVLLHGLGATGAIWQALVAARPADRPGRIMTLDLPGHGGSGHLDSYDMPIVAARVGEAIQANLSGSGGYRVLGHSYGGVVALALAGAGVSRVPDFVYGLGIKSIWGQAELEGMHGLAHKPARLFPDQEGAREWYLKVSGLTGLDTGGVDCAGRGVVESPAGEWRLALDPALYRITPPDLAALTRDQQGRFSLGYGADDSLVDVADLQRFDPAVCSMEGGGHNIMVDNPQTVWRWLTD